MKDAWPHIGRHSVRDAGEDKEMGQMGDPSIDSLHDTYEDQLSAARYRAERDQLRQELDRIKRGPQVTMSAYDLLPDEDRETLAWVREQGGLDALKAYTECFNNLLRECHGYRDLAREYEKRLMPEGYEWPRYETGELLRYKDRYISDGAECEVWHVDFDSYGEATILNSDYSKCSLDKGERVKRPAPKVLDADGVEIRVGETVYHVADGRAYVVREVREGGAVVEPVDGRPRGRCRADYLTHERPVLDADGVPIHEGDTVYEVGETYPPFIVSCLPEPGAYRAVKVMYPSGDFTSLDPERLTHQRPDSWERIEEDLGDEMAKQQCGPISPELACKLAGEFVRRCQALAERGE